MFDPLSWYISGIMLISGNRALTTTSKRLKHIRARKRSRQRRRIGCLVLAVRLTRRWVFLQFCVHDLLVEVLWRNVAVQGQGVRDQRSRDMVGQSRLHLIEAPSTNAGTEDLQVKNKCVPLKRGM